MKKIFMILSLSIITIFVTVAIAQTVSDLQREFVKRDSIKLTADQGNMINFLKLIKYPTEPITEIELLNDSAQSFLIKDRNNIICFGSMSEPMLICKNKLGLPGVTLLSGTEPQGTTATGAISALQQEFVRRHSIAFSDEQNQVIDFLKTIAYSTESIKELELLNDASESFLIKDQNNVVCFGSVLDKMLRCKNEIGITGVSFTGDSD